MSSFNVKTRAYLRHCAACVITAVMFYNTPQSYSSPTLILQTGIPASLAQGNLKKVVDVECEVVSRLFFPVLACFNKLDER